MTTNSPLSLIRPLLDAAPVPLLVTELETGVFRACNRRFAETFQVEESDCLGRTTLDLGFWVDHEARSRFLELLLADSGKPAEIETSFRWGDGSIHPGQLSGSILVGSANPRLLLLTCLDLTNLRESQRRELEILNRHRFLEGNTSDLVARISPEGKRLYTSPAILPLLGWTPEELEGTSAFEHFHPDDLPWLTEGMARLMTTGAPETAEYRTRRRDGSYIWVESACSPLRDPETGKVIEIHVSTRDITARRKAEEESRRSERLFRGLFTSLSEGILLLDSSGSVIQANERAHEILGIPQGALLRQSLFDPSWAFLDDHGDDLPATDLPGVQTLHDHLTRRDVVVGVKTPIGLVWLSQSCSILAVDGDDGEAHLLVSFTDVTERKTTERARRESDEKYRQLFENMAGGFALHEVIQDETGKVVDYRFLEANPAFELLTGLPVSEILGRTVLEVLPETETFWIDTYGAVALGGPSLAFEQFSASLGKTFEVRVFSPQPGRFATLFHDITTRCLAETALRESESRLRLVADLSIDMISRHTMDSSYLWASPSCRELLGVSPSEVVGRSAFDFIHPDDASLVASELERIFSEGTTRTQYRMRDVSGQTVWVETISRLLTDPETNAPLEIHCSTRDVSAQRAQRELLATSQRLARLGGWILDFETGNHQWSPELLGIHNWDPTTPPPTPGELASRISPESLRQIELLQRGLIANGTSWSCVVRGLDLRGNPLIVRSQAEPIHRDGKVVGARGTSQDITEHELVREEMEAASQLTRAILDTSEALILLLDRDGRILRFNHACEMATGWTESEVLGKRVPDLFVPPEDRAAIVGMLTGTVGDLKRHHQNQWLRRDGGTIWTTWANSTILGKSGELEYIVSVGIDTTRSRAMQIELQESEARLRCLIDTAPEAVVILDASSGRFIDVNPAAETLYGLPRWRLFELGPIELSPVLQPSGVPSPIAAREFVGRALAGDFPLFEWVHLRPDGTEVLCEIHLTRLPSEGRDLVRGSITDISERRKTESVVESLVRVTASHFGQAFFDVLLKDLSQILGVRHAFIGRSVEASNTLRTLSLCSDGILVPNIEFPLDGTPCHDVYGKGLVSIASGARDRYPDSTHLRDLDADGFLGVPLYSSSNEPIGVLVVMDSRPMVENDLARSILTIFASRAQGEIERLEAENRLRSLNQELESRVQSRTQELLGTNRELEAFSYSVSHDLRSPLRAIDGFTQAIQEDYATHFDETGRHYLSRIRSASHRMADLIDDLLSLSRSSRVELRIHRIDLSAMATEIMAGLSAATPDRSFEFHLDPDLEVVGDPVLLRSALENLLDNSWKYTRFRKSPVIELHQVPAPEGFVGFAVSDNGAGFDMAHEQKLFGTFQRLHALDEFEGNGIGLATVRRIIERHGGSIRAHGEIDKGATFQFQLPIQSIPEQRTGHSPIPHPTWRD